jgi:hypothetical protein
LAHPDAHAAYLRENDAWVPLKHERRSLRIVQYWFADRDRVPLLAGLEICEGLKSYKRIHILNGNHAIKDVWL